jgi:hypothetical protein
MGKGIKEDARAQELEPVSLSALIHRHVRIAIETPSTRSCGPRWGRVPTSAVKSDEATAMA